MIFKMFKTGSARPLEVYNRIVLWEWDEFVAETNLKTWRLPREVLSPSYGLILFVPSRAETTALYGMHFLL